MSDSLYRIGLISDTHNRMHPRVGELFRNVDEIWHLGDICDEPILEALEQICPKLTSVLGNNDYGLQLPLIRSLQREGESFYLIHVPPEKNPVNSGWVLHGHTHIPKDERRENVRWFNPGSAGLANKGFPLSLAILTKLGKAPFQAQIIHL